MPLIEVTPSGSVAAQLEACEGHMNIGRIGSSSKTCNADGSAEGNYAFLFSLNSSRMDPDTLASIRGSPEICVGLMGFLKSLSDVEEQVTFKTENPNIETPPIAWKRCQAVIINGEQSPLSQLKAAMLKRLVFVTGTVMRMCTPKLVCMSMRFGCTACGNVVDVALDGGPMEYPKSCVGRCKGFSFKPIPNQSTLVEVQTLKLQGNNQQLSAVGQQRDQDDVSQSVDVELRGILMEQAAPGDVVTVGGIVTTRRGEKQFAGTHQICLDAVSIVSHSMAKASAAGKGRSSALQKMLSSLVEIDTSATTGTMVGGAAYDRSLFYEYVQHEGWFEKLVASVSPGIFGHYTLKAAMLLSLVGGSERGELSRPAIHLLMVGDPGLGKSQMLRAACQLSARSAFVSANTSSTCGLTVSLSRDGSSGETTFEAGAVVHGDGGITCIDELDKGTNEHKALLEVMEQQSVSIAKAGMIFSMPIQTTVMAAGNPLSGKFDTGKTLCENINMSPALLSRFDIVHVMRDCDSTSAGLTSHILKVHLNTQKDQQPAATPQPQQGLLSIAELGRFLAFAKKERQPTLSDEAAQLLKDAYMAKRRESRGQHSDLPITPRYLQSLIRLSEAFAKIYLRPVVLPEDAMQAIALHTACSTFVNDKGKPVLPAKGMTKGRQQKANIVATVLAQVAEHMREHNSTTIRHNDLLDICADAGAKSPAALIQQLGEGGSLLSSGGSTYRLHKDHTR